MQSSHLENEYQCNHRSSSENLVSGYIRDDFFSYNVESFSGDESLVEILTKKFTPNRLQFRVVLAKGYHPIAEIDKWIIENVECEWNCGYEQRTSMQNEYSFSDLATATLFRLRF